MNIGLMNGIGRIAGPVLNGIGIVLKYYGEFYMRKFVNENGMYKTTKEARQDATITLKLKNEPT